MQFREYLNIYSNRYESKVFDGPRDFRSGNRMQSEAIKCQRRRRRSRLACSSWQTRLIFQRRPRREAIAFRLRVFRGKFVGCRAEQLLAVDGIQFKPAGTAGNKDMALCPHSCVCKYHRTIILSTWHMIWHGIWCNRMALAVKG